MINSPHIQENISNYPDEEPNPTILGGQRQNWPDDVAERGGVGGRAVVNIIHGVCSPNGRRSTPAKYVV